MSKPQDSGGFEKNFSDFTQLCKKRPVRAGERAANAALRRNACPYRFINIKHAGSACRRGAGQKKLRKK